MNPENRWRKLGRIFAPQGENWWMHSHAALPIAEQIEGDVYRVYFSSRDKFNRSFTGYIVVSLRPPFEILDISDKPVLSPGALGEFDDSGAMGCWLTESDKTKYLYYIGWNTGKTVPFRNSIGVASAESGSFKRLFAGPIVDRTAQEPHFCASCCVLAGDQKWRMWYLSCTGWELIDNSPRHRYHIKYAESNDGISWQRDGHVAIDFASDKEFAISRPSVLFHNDQWYMWYSYRGSSYRIGYAESEDGINWIRMDQHANLSPSETGWDSEMIEYPFVFIHDGVKHMLYNGNGYGKSGFGLAVMDR